MLLAFIPGLALGQVPINPDDPSSFADALLKAFDSRNWALLVVLGVLLLVWGIRKFGAKLWAPLGDPRLAPALAMLVSVGVLLAASLAAGAPLTLAMVLKAALVALAAGGLWSGTKEMAKKSGDAAAAGITTDAQAAEMLRRGPTP